MDLLINFLENTAYFFYPKGLHESEPEYHNSFEHRNFLFLHSKWSELTEDFHLVLNEIEAFFGKEKVIANGTTANHIPCYQIELLLNGDIINKEVLSIYISMFIPFYHIVRLKRLPDGSISDNFDIPQEVDNFVESSMKKNLYYHRFPKELLSHKITKLKVVENFTVMNAFFTDYYRIV